VLGMGASQGGLGGRLRLGLLAAVAALFVLIPASQASAAEFTLNITIEPEEGGGVICEAEGAGVECNEEFEEGQEVWLIAQPEELEYEFAGFSGDCAPEGEECLVVMEGSTPKAVTVTFKPIEYQLTINTKGSGTGGVQCDIGSGPGPCAKKFPIGTSVILVAKEGSGSQFVGWGGECEYASSETECEIEMYEDHVVTATFNAVGGGGEESGDDGESSSGSQPTLTPPPPPPGPGKLRVAGAGLYKGGKATLSVSCKDGGRCKGTVKLIAKLKVGHKKKKVTVGKASFSLAAGAMKALTIKLSGPAKRLLGKGRTLTANVRGSGVTASKVKIRPTER